MPQDCPAFVRQLTVRASRLPNTVSGAVPSPPMGASSCSARASRSHPAASANRQYEGKRRCWAGRCSCIGTCSARTSCQCTRLVCWAAIHELHWVGVAHASRLHPATSATSHICSRGAASKEVQTHERTCRAARQHGQQLRVPPGQQSTHRGVHQLEVNILCSTDGRARTLSRWGGNGGMRVAGMCHTCSNTWAKWHTLAREELHSSIPCHNEASK